METKVGSLPLDEWPICDRDGWMAACVPSQRLRPGGLASHMQPNTQDSYARMYGYLLDFCSRSGSLDPHADAAGHVAPDLVSAFLEELEIRVGSVTRALYIERIRRVAEILAPDHNFGWLREIGHDLRHLARPRPKEHRIIASDRLLAVGLDLICRSETSNGKTHLERAQLVRNGMMVALLAQCPIRLKNFAALRLGREITCIGGAWWIILDATQTKSGRPDERPVPKILTVHIERWLAHWRPLFFDPSRAFLPSTKGGALAYGTVGTTIARVTLEETGINISAHLFRDCAVHTVATEAGAEMGVATALLHHTDPRVAEKTLQQGNVADSHSEVSGDRAGGFGRYLISRYNSRARFRRNHPCLPIEV